MSIVAGIDTSTQSCTVELRDAETGSLLGGGRALHPVATPPRSEQNPLAWWQAFEVALKAAVADAGVTVGDIDAMSVAGQCHGLVMLDAQGQPLRNAKLWNDTESSVQADRMVAELGKATWSKRTGSVPTAAFTITKLAWVAQHEPHLLARVGYVLLPHDYLTFRLTGRAVTDRSEASGTGYFSTDGFWQFDLLERFVSSQVRWSEVLPVVLGPTARAGLAATPAAAALGLRGDVVVGAGAGDTHAGALGMGMREGDVGYSLGTSGVVFATSPHAVHDTRGWVNGVADATGAYLPLVCTLNATRVTDTFARILGVTLDELGALALAAEPLQERPVLAAFFDGERSPDRPHAHGTLHGLTNHSTREQMALAAFEGVLLGLLRGQRALEELGVPTHGDVVLMGGGARGEAYRQVLADVTGRRVITKDAPEAVAAGAGIQAAAVLLGRDIQEIRDRWMPAITSSTTPRDIDSVYARYLTVADWRGADSTPTP